MLLVGEAPLESMGQELAYHLWLLLAVAFKKRLADPPAAAIVNRVRQEQETAKPSPFSRGRDASRKKKAAARPLPHHPDNCCPYREILG
ncbi:MAG: hypothetical protein JRJ12_06525 [Deltaproteobacteria bacterium]|nr:hypothetical protein [Deltaproteobacteria bacterium]MBW2071616.1 hypothetical protein [Deltaproteobacteria bacterium]